MDLKGDAKDDEPPKAESNWVRIGKAGKPLRPATRNDRKGCCEDRWCRGHGKSTFSKIGNLYELTTADRESFRKGGKESGKLLKVTGVVDS